MLEPPQQCFWQLLPLARTAASPGSAVSGSHDDFRCSSSRQSQFLPLHSRPLPSQTDSVYRRHGRSIKRACWGSKRTFYHQRWRLTVQAGNTSTIRSPVTNLFLEQYWEVTPLLTEREIDWPLWVYSLPVTWWRVYVSSLEHHVYPQLPCETQCPW